MENGIRKSGEFALGDLIEEQDMLSLQRFEETQLIADVVAANVKINSDVSFHAKDRVIVQPMVQPGRNC